MQAYGLTHVGRVRTHNQDYLYSSSDPVGNLKNLFLVADGMGGHQAGDYASRFAVEHLVAYLKNYGQSQIVPGLSQAIATVNAELYRRSMEEPHLRGMGTTLVAATVIGNTLHFANIGDSRLYLIDDNIRQFSKDHSLVEEMVRLGGIKAEDARNHPDKNIITRAMGVKEDAEADFYEFHIKRGDVILMCTDGLSNMVEDEDMFGLVKGSRDIVEAVQMLIDRANSNGGRDNIGVVLAEPVAGEESTW